MFEGICWFKVSFAIGEIRTWGARHFSSSLCAATDLEDATPVKSQIFVRRFLLGFASRVLRLQG